MKNVQAILPLSPMQELMLLHRLSRPDADTGFQQQALEIGGHLDAGAWRRAAQTVVERHAALRAAFVSQGLSKPVQVIRQTLPVTFDEQDLRPLDDDAQRARIADFLDADRRIGFDPARPPLLRFGLLRLGPRRHLLVVSAHHLVLDRWGWRVMMRELFAAAEAQEQGRPAGLPEPGLYRDYFAFLKRQHEDDARAWWRRELGSARAPTPLYATTGGGGERQRAELDAAATRALTQWARGQRITLSAAALGLLAMLLGTRAARRDAIMGVTVSGRPAEVPGIETMVGSFSNNLPLRVTWEAHEPVADVLRRVQRSQAESQRFAHTPAALIGEWIGLGGRELFDCLAVFQNDPSHIQDEAAGEEAAAEGGRTVSALSSTTASGYPLMVMMFPGDRLRLAGYPDGRRADAPFAGEVLDQFAALLGRFAQRPDQLAGDLLAPIAPAAGSDAGEPAAPPANTAGARRDAGPVGPPPDTAIQRAVAAIWCEVLGVAAVTLHDNFFELGGTSMQALQAVARIRAATGVRINPAELAVGRLGHVAAACRPRPQEV